MAGSHCFALSDHCFGDHRCVGRSLAVPFTYRWLPSPMLHLVADVQLSIRPCRHPAPPMNKTILTTDVRIVFLIFHYTLWQMQRTEKPHCVDFYKPFPSPCRLPSSYPRAEYRSRPSHLLSGMLLHSVRYSLRRQ